MRALVSRFVSIDCKVHAFDAASECHCAPARARCQEIHACNASSCLPSCLPGCLPPAISPPAPRWTERKPVFHGLADVSKRCLVRRVQERPDACQLLSANPEQLLSAFELLAQGFELQLRLFHRWLYSRGRPSPFATWRPLPIILSVRHLLG
ncbi:hypothetical protein PsYK624_076010 [Phanerochaete sordida]|uniref:Uncharacterized protein n=1 Tax=Phanerochaete sordida TaxID=48140 RepID=A0A9P3LDE7_9APHY|nr:hypothetical protein PsYK624_076010 [Phanerochaete sordida]